MRVRLLAFGGFRNDATVPVACGGAAHPHTPLLRIRYRRPEGRWTPSADASGVWLVTRTETALFRL